MVVHILLLLQPCGSIASVALILSFFSPQVQANNYIPAFPPADSRVNAALAKVSCNGVFLQPLPVSTSPSSPTFNVIPVIIPVVVVLLLSVAAAVCIFRCVSLLFFLSAVAALFALRSS